MKNIFLRRDTMSWRWKEMPASAWNAFPDKVNNLKSMQDYFTEGGKRNQVNLTFVSNDMKPANFFEITPDRKNAILNGGQKEIPLPDFEFFPNSEQVKWFRDRTTPDVAEKADRLPDDWSRVKFLSENAVDQVKQDYQSTMKIRKSDAEIKTYLSRYNPESVSEYYFL